MEKLREQIYNLIRKINDKERLSLILRFCKRLLD